MPWSAIILFMGQVFKKMVLKSMVMVKLLMLNLEINLKGGGIGIFLFKETGKSYLCKESRDLFYRFSYR